MEIYCKELNKSFNSDESLFKALKENEKRIISLKTDASKFSDGLHIPTILKKDDENKGVSGLEDGYIYPVINTTKILDSHRDLHIDGIWKKTVKEQAGRIYYAINHELKIGSIVAYPKDVEVFTKVIKWEQLGKDYEGSTEALIFKVKVMDYANKDALNAINEKLPVENSVSMVYQKISLAINSDEKDYAINKQVFDEYYPMIANKDDFEDLKYFWVVKEAAIRKEGSMVAIGSNSETPILYPKTEEPSKDTQNNKSEEADKPSLSKGNIAFVMAMQEILTQKN